MDSTDREIYRAAIQGDRDAFELIIRGSSRTLFAIAYGVLQNREEAEDVVQDAFVKAWKSRWRVRDPEKFPAWLATIARHRARDVARRRRDVALDRRTRRPGRRRLREPRRAGARSLLEQPRALRARGLARDPSRRGHAPLFRRARLRHDRAHSRPNEWRAPRHSRARPANHAQAPATGARLLD